MSKVAVIALAKVQQKSLAQKTDIIINSVITINKLDSHTFSPHKSIFQCCPGFVATGMTQHAVDMFKIKIGEEKLAGLKLKDVDDGADTLVYLALLPPDAEGPKGQFVAERKSKNVVTACHKP